MRSGETATAGCLSSADMSVPEIKAKANLANLGAV